MKSDKRAVQRRIAYEAARILTELRSDDHLFAIRKAASRLGLNNKRSMPNRTEIEQALREQQRLFRGDEQQNALKKLRHAALQAMRAMKQFNPLLVGPIGSGTADGNSRIRLHLFAELPEQVLMLISEMNIPWQEKDLTMKFSDNSRHFMPCFYFLANETPIELVVLPDKRPFNSPLDPLDSQPVKGLNIKQLEGLLEISLPENSRTNSIISAR